jgi:hypothetical protein
VVGGFVVFESKERPKKLPVFFSSSKCPPLPSLAAVWKYQKRIGRNMTEKSSRKGI